MIHCLSLSMSIPQGTLQILSKDDDDRVHESGTKAHLSCKKGHERVYEKVYKFTPFIRNLQILAIVYVFCTPVRNSFVEPFVQK